ncbi:MAG TPA: hypothetical protein VFN67_25080 [Polyangiales bacterium]|nr:hypothetical protein [Polyangiales bacterium]
MANLSIVPVAPSGAHYQLGRFQDAAREFEVAYGLSGRAALLYNVYISYREALDTPKAAGALRGYLTFAGRRS